MKLQKGKQTFEVAGEIQAAAFKAAGWVEVKPKAAKPAVKKQADKAAD